ncbi:MAG: monomethylamine:corrinoid methyltransferase [Deltaproteobacteria bacterium]|nr:monomethylamine:corrinoid methyltransferase [Deltaproteobacteria bacterium]
MPDFLDFMERAVTGPIVSEHDFYMKTLIPSIRRLLDDFDIKYDPTSPLPWDDNLADRLFEAAIELLAATGVYCDGTNRIISMDREEIKEALEGLPEGRTFGEGSERRLFVSRKPGDSRPPWCHVGTGIVASSEDIATAEVEGYGRIPEANSISIPALNRVRGMPVIGGSPLEIHATINSVQAGRRALWRCGRPGLPILNLISSATTAVATIAGTHPTFGLRPSDGWLIDVIAEMKVNFETLNRLAFVLITGGNVGSAALPILGGYGGGPAGTALLMAAYYLVGILLFRAVYHLTGPIHFNHGCSTTRGCLWVFSVVGRATSRNTRFPAIGLGYSAAGPCTRMYFYETAAVNLCCVTSGYGGVQTVHPARAVIEDGVTPLEALFNVETAYAATGMEPERANELVDRLLEKYEKDIENAPPGKRYQECYDMGTKAPLEEYVRLYGETKEELAKMGIPFGR